jgi:predicted MFS family arabinose efflux permease
VNGGTPSLNQAVLWWGGLQAARFLLPPLLPRITDTLGLSPGGVGLAVVLVAPSLPVVVAGTVLVAAGYKTQFPIADAVVMEAAPEGSVGADIGAARAVFLGASALGPGVVGLLAELTNFETAFWLLVACFLTCALVLARQYRRHSRGSSNS